MLALFQSILNTEQVTIGIMKEITDTTLEGVTVEEYWEHPHRNEGYALARLGLNAFLEKASV